MTTIQYSSNDVLVNTNTTGTQSNQSITVLSDGSYIICWQSFAQDGSNFGIYAQRFDAAGNKIGSETRINTTTTDHQLVPAITALNDGGYVICWASNSQDGSNYGVYAQKYDASGTKVGGETLVNTYTLSDQNSPSITALTGGGYVISWVSTGQDGSQTGIYAQRYNSLGEAVGTETLVNTTTSDYQAGVYSAALTDGGYVIVWHSFAQDGVSYGIYAQRFDASGATVGGETLINTETLDSQNTPTITGLTDGGYVIAWQSNGQDGSAYGIYAQRYDAAGAKVGGETLVNTYTTNEQSQPAITSLSNGGYVIVWRSNGQDGNQFGIYAQKFDAASNKVGNEFLVNQYIPSSQVTPKVKELTDGSLLFTWSGYGSTDTGGVYARRFFSGDYTGNTSAVDTITGTSGDDIIAVTGSLIANDVIDALGGNDTLQISGNVNFTTFTATNFEAVKLDNNENTITITAAKTVGITSYNGGGGNDTIFVNDAAFDLTGKTFTSIETIISNIIGGTNFTTNNYASALLVKGGTYGAKLNYTGGALSKAQFGALFANGVTSVQIGSNFYYPDGGLINSTSEALVNTYTSNQQNTPTVAKLKDGSYVIAWQSLAQDSHNYGIFAQRYDSTGAKVGSETQINTYITYDQAQPSITGLVDGGYIICWHSASQDGNGWGIYAQRYDYSGVAQGAETRINTTTVNDQAYPAITALASGGYVITWYSNGQDGSGYGIYSQRYDAFGVAQGSETLVNTYTTSYQINPTVAALDGGGYVIVWQSDGQDGASYGIYAQRFDALGVPVEFDTRINTYTGDSQSEPTVTALSDGGYIIAWQSLAQDGSGYGIYAQRYDSEGSALGPETLVNTYTTNNQYQPAISRLSDGGYVICWASFTQDFGTTGVYAQKFDASGTKVGGEYLINSYSTSSQQMPAIAGLNDGRFIITWQSNGQDGSGDGIYSKIMTIDVFNHAPTAANPLTHADIFEDNAFTFAADDILANFSDSDGDTFSISNISSTSGLVTNNGDGTYTFTPTANYFGNSTITFTVSDGMFSVNSDMNFAIQAVNDAPILSSSQAVLADGADDAPYVFTLADLLTGYSDPDGDTLSVNNVISFDGPVLPFAPGVYHFLPMGGMNGQVTIYYQVTDGNADPINAQLTFNINHTPIITNINVYNDIHSDIVLNVDLSGATAGSTSGPDENGNYSADGVLTPLQSVQTNETSVDTVVDQNTGDITKTHYIDRTYTTYTSVNATGSDFGDTLIGLDGNDTLRGGGGGDSLDGGAGADTMYGGAGDDGYTVDNVGDIVIEDSVSGVDDGGNDTVYSQFGFTLGAFIENLHLTGSDNFDATGNDLDNYIWGNSGSNTLDGKAGADTMMGGAGNDTYWVDNASDIVDESDGEGSDLGGLDVVQSSVDYTLGDYVENLYSVSTSNLTLTGNALANNILGNDGADTLYGMGDADILNGGLGNDTLYGGEGNDSLTGGRGNDTMYGGDGDDTYYIDDVGDIVSERTINGVDTGGLDEIYTTVNHQLDFFFENMYAAGGNNLTLTGNTIGNEIWGFAHSNSNETLNGLGGNDTLKGFGGNDILKGGTGADEMYGGAGDDTYYVGDIGDIVSESDAGSDTGGVDRVISSIGYTLGDYVENLYLTGTGSINGTGNDIDNAINGNAGVNILSGLGGADTLNGMAGADTMYGGAGNDVYNVDNVGDVVSEETVAGVDDGGTDLVNSIVSYTLGAFVEQLKLKGNSNINGTGNSLANLIIGNNGNNTLNGMSGADTMYGGLGDDTYVIDESGDRIKEMEDQGIDTVISSISTTLAANIENLTLTTSGDLKGNGNSLANTIRGNIGNNTLNGMAGADTMYGGAGNDLYYVDDFGDIASEQSVAGVDDGGTDKVMAGVDYTLGSFIENLSLTGTSNINGTGNSLANVIYGNDGNNTINGAGGNDVLRAGLGDDTYFFDGNFGIDVITDTGGAADRIQFGAGIDTSKIIYETIGNDRYIGISDGTTRTASKVANRIRIIGGASGIGTIESIVDFSGTALSSVINRPSSLSMTQTAAEKIDITTPQTQGAANKDANLLIQAITQWTKPTSMAMPDIISIEDASTGKNLTTPTPTTKLKPTGMQSFWV